MQQHTTDWISLISGLVFLGIGAGAITTAETGLLFDGRWIAPVLLVVVAVGILASIRGRTNEPIPDTLTPAERRAMGELPEPPA